MAKKPGKDQVIKKKQDILSFLKQINKWLISKNRTEEDIEYILQKFELDHPIPYLFQRIVSLGYNNPNIIVFVNRYLNNLFDFSKYTEVGLMQTLGHIFESNGHNKFNKFFFLKSSENKDEYKYKVKKIIREYYKIINKRYLNDSELNFLYKLFYLGTISKEEILRMDTCVNGKESKIDFSNLELLLSNDTEEDNSELEEKIKEYIDESKYRLLPENIRMFCEELKKIKQIRPECQKCKLFEKPMVILDTNMEDFGPVNIAWFAFSPGKDDIPYDKPLSGKPGELQRRKMYFLPENTKWLITNTMLCQTNSQKDIGSEKQILETVGRCRLFFDKIFEKFPAEYYSPVGDIASKSVGLTGSVTFNNGKLIDNNGFKAIPLIHPSSILHNPENGKLFDLGFDSIYSVLGGKNIISISKDPITKSNLFNGNIEIIKELSSDLTLFDAVGIDDSKVLMIFIDQSGQKKYILKDNRLPVYIKVNNWKDNEMISKDFDLVVYLNDYEKNKVTNLAKDSMHTIKKTSTIRGN